MRWIGNICKGIGALIMGCFYFSGMVLVGALCLPIFTAIGFGVTVKICYNILDGKLSNIDYDAIIDELKQKENEENTNNTV